MRNSSKRRSVHRWVTFVLATASVLSADRGDAARQAAASKPPGVLLRLPEFTLLDQQGHGYGSEQLRGKVWIANFVFTRCSTICPQTMRELGKLQAALREDAAWSEIRLVSFSVDPEHDRPELLRRFADTHAADAEHWKFLTGSRGQLSWLTREGFELPVGEALPGAEMPILHSQSFVLVDRERRVRGSYDALDAAGREQLQRDLQAVLAEAGPTVVRVPSASGIDPEWLEPRRQAQLASAAGIGVAHDFRFRDRIAESGITFVHGFTDDSGRAYKPVHYDHGNSVSIADVDGDERFDLLFMNQVGANELWRNLGGGRFENVTERAGIGLDQAIGVAAAFADTDNDGDPDLYMTTVRGGNFLFENDGSGRFADVTERSGLQYEGHSSGALFFDYDRDGLLDLFVCNVGVYTTELQGRAGYYIGVTDAFGGHLKPAERNEKSRLYRNLGGNRFEDVTVAMGLFDFSWNGDASPLDVNGDDWPDLFVLNMQGHDHYYENVGGERFERRSREIFPKTPWGSMGIKALDFDNDGDQDLLLTDMHSDMSETVGLEREKLKSRMQWPEAFLVSGGKSIFGNALYRNDGDGRFTEVSDEVGAENYWPWGLSVGDLNADGFEDVFITSGMNYPFSYGVNTLLLNDGGRRLVDSEFILGVEPRRGGRTSKPWFELDCSGEDEDDPLVCGKYSLSGRVVVWAALGSRSSVIFDLDEDGDLDIVTNEFGDAPMVLISDLAERKPLRYLKIELEGTRSNRDGLGARVVVSAGGRDYHRSYDGVSGYLSHSIYPLYFGLGEAEAVDAVEVRWPSGEVQRLEGPIETNATVRIVEQAPKPADAGAGETR